MKITFRLLLGIVLLSSALVARAELSSQAYLDMQHSASEQLVIWVDSREVRTDENEKRNVVIKARVKQVTHSATGLEPGQKIVIRYDEFVPKSDLVGPRPIPSIDEDSEVPAFLTKSTSGNYYIPAARGYTFQAIGVKATTVFSRSPSEINHKANPWQNPRP